MSIDSTTLEAPSSIHLEALLSSVRTNIVQSIRAFRMQDLQDAADYLEHRFFYANLAGAQSKQDVLDLIGQQFTPPIQIGKNFDSLYDGMTNPIQKSAPPPPGFIVVLEHIPANTKFDKEAREQLLDVFRDTADFWGDRKIPFRCFYSFSVARTAQIDRSTDIPAVNKATSIPVDTSSEVADKIPTTKLVDISAQALRMSSPFNPSYWTSL